LAFAASAVEVEFRPNVGSLPPGLPFSAAVRVGDTYYLSGQVGTQPGVDTLVPGGIEPEARQTLENIRGVLKKLNLGPENVVKCTVMLDDIDEWGQFNAIYQDFFKPPYPARSAFGADGLALGARVEVECIAARSLR
jgi:reactive intermediate/imine deaminase